MTETTTGTDVRWARKQAAMRDLILRMLCGSGGVLLDSSGGIPSRIREHYGIPTSKQISTCISEVLGLMERSALVKREMNGARTCTYSIELANPLNPAQVIELEFYRASNLRTFLGSGPDPDGPERVLEEVQAGYAAIQTGAQTAEHRNSEGQVAINVTRLLEEVGYVGRRARRIRYYLRTLNLIKSGRKHEDDQKLWMWSVSDEEIPLHRLMALIVGEQDFDSWDEQQQARKRARDAEGPDDKPARPVVAAKPGPPPGRRAATPKPTASPATDETEASTTDRLLGIIARLEAQVEGLQTEAKTTDENHRKELRAKDDEIAGLRRQLGERQQIDERVAGVLARYSTE